MSLEDLALETDALWSIVYDLRKLSPVAQRRVVAHVNSVMRGGDHGDVGGHTHFTAPAMAHMPPPRVAEMAALASKMGRPFSNADVQAELGITRTGADKRIQVAMHAGVIQRVATGRYVSAVQAAAPEPAAAAEAAQAEEEPSGGSEG